MEDTVVVTGEDSRPISATMQTGRKLVHELVEAQARMRSGFPALVSERGQLTYAAVDSQASCLARQLVSIGVGPECVVSIVLSRSAELIVAILAVLKSGAAFNPMEPSWPDARLACLLDEIKPQCVITSSPLRQRPPLCTQRLLLADCDQQPVPDRQLPTTAQVKVSPQNLAYVLFTSGSTGKPKAVGVEHQNISNYVHSVLGAIRPLPGSQFALLTSVAADLGYTMLFPALCSGGCLHVVSDDAVRSPELLDACFRNRQPDYMKITPSYATALLSSEVAANLLPRECLILGGESLHWSLVDRIRDVAADLRIMNHYGPTETTVGVLVNPSPERHAASSLTVPLGRPLANTQVNILDQNMTPLPDGRVGELYIGGEGVSRGYLGRSDLTAKQFVPDQFSKVPGARLYRTGDLASRLPDGNVEFHSRVDHQIKISGYRVELGEIEAGIASHPAVRRAVVQVQDNDGQIRLIAYVDVHYAQTIDGEALRKRVKDQLPDYMVPNQFVFVNEMPLLPSGKIDRQALKPMPVASPGFEESATPQGPVEERIRSLWLKVLRVNDVDPTANFFEAGGNSLRIIQLQSAIKREFGKMIKIPTLFAHPTIRAMARLMSDALVEPGDAGKSVAESRRAALAGVRAQRVAAKESVR